MTRTTSTTAIALLMTAVTCGCGDSDSPSRGAGESRSATGGNEPGSGPLRVASIVFVGQKDACPCTRERIDSTWGALQDALSRSSGIAVERIQLDVDERRYDQLDDLGSLIVAPGIYLFNAEGGFVELLQGEVEAYRIAEALR